MNAGLTTPTVDKGLDDFYSARELYFPIFQWLEKRYLGRGLHLSEVTDVNVLFPSKASPNGALRHRFLQSLHCLTSSSVFAAPGVRDPRGGLAYLQRQAPIPTLKPVVMWIFSIKLEKKDEGEENMNRKMKRETMYTTKGNHAYVLGRVQMSLSAMRYPHSARERREDKLWTAHLVFGKREVSAHTLEYQREEDVARKQKVTQRRQYRELIDIAESHEGVLLFARCIFAATWSPETPTIEERKALLQKRIMALTVSGTMENRIQGIQSETRRRSCIIRFEGHCRLPIIQNLITPERREAAAV
ncbi:hypothetical protein BS47DRAFT_1483052 [Hydnum rufescens UP504]|uniref:Uncharacterized protein n=1 Tax=Hydnum rufescens UP504 TaxID=1448309 RepID=A0A9P6E0B2_9AGAM|nr:hypothetical protein BS47DRAFT_1483052 [Hydnum rufescens UP504]